MEGTSEQSDRRDKSSVCSLEKESVQPMLLVTLNSDRGKVKLNKARPFYCLRPALADLTCQAEPHASSPLTNPLDHRISSQLRRNGPDALQGSSISKIL